MSKLKKADGAPAYIQLYSIMMMLLLAFFIVLVTLSGESKNESFKSDIGKVQQSFGLTGGIGMLRFPFAEDSQRLEGQIPATEEEKTDEGVDSWRLRGSGGSGTTDIDFERGMPTSMRVVVPYQFAEGRTSLSSSMLEYLDIVGTVLADNSDFSIAVRQFTVGAGSVPDAALVASARAGAVQRFLHESCGLSPDRITAVGYAHPSFLPVDQRSEIARTNQLLIFDLYRKKAN